MFLSGKLLEERISRETFPPAVFLNLEKYTGMLFSSDDVYGIFYSDYPGIYKYCKANFNFYEVRLSLGSLLLLGVYLGRGEKVPDTLQTKILRFAVKKLLYKVKI